MPSSFGTEFTMAHFVEVHFGEFVDPAPDPDYGPRTATLRPPAGYPLLVKDAFTGADLSPIITNADGYWKYTLPEDGRRILVSGNQGATYVGPLFSIESDIAVHDGSIGGGGGPSGTGTVKSINTVSPDPTSGDVHLTPADIGALGAGATIPASQVSGLKAVATSNSYNDLDNLPPSRDVNETSPGSWQLRPATPERCRWNTLPGSTSVPPTSGSTAGGVGMVPNYDIYLQWPA
jgi:hypothetical protein